MRKGHEEDMRKLWLQASVVIVILTTLVAILTLATGGSRTELLGRIGWILYSTTLFLFGLVIGAWFVFKLKILDIMTEGEIANLPDGVTK